MVRHISTNFLVVSTNLFLECTILVNITGYYFILLCIGNDWLIMHYIPKGAYTCMYMYVRCCCKVNVYQNDYLFAAAILVHIY